MAAAPKWTEEQKQFIVKKIKDEHKHPKELIKPFFDKFKVNRSFSGIRDAFRRVVGESFTNYVQQEEEASLDRQEEKVIDWLKKDGQLTVGELSRRLDRSKQTVYEILDSLKSKGHEVDYCEETRKVDLITELKRVDFEPMDVEPLVKNRLRIGHVSDTHLCSKYQQLTILHTAYKVFEEEKVDFALHYGDLSGGSPRMHRGFKDELFLQDVDDQHEYIVEQYPITKKFKTYIIGGGTHDSIWAKDVGYNFVKNFCKERTDIIYVGDVEGNFRLKGEKNQLLHRLIHPSGGVPYAKSYRGQKVMEGLIAEAVAVIRSNIRASQVLPHTVGMGHLHIQDYFIDGGVHCFLVPCLQSRTPYLKQKGLFPMVGFMITEYQYDDNLNINRVKIEVHDYGYKVKEKDY